ncbi:MAG: TrbI/VirB10 family protein, partial [Rickettsiales bacterium]|nr:TrbI/VirB10 family protein [Rickettsiales bacterium]
DASDLEKQLEKDIQNAEKQQEEEVKKQKPKLAQKAATKYAKYAIFTISAILIGYKMFFSVKAAQEPTVKKKEKKKYSYSTANEAKRQEEGFRKAKPEEIRSSPSQEKVNVRKLASIDDQSIVNAENISNVPVPSLNLPAVPEVPKVEKIVVEEKKKEDKKKGNMPGLPGSPLSGQNGESALTPETRTGRDVKTNAANNKAKKNKEKSALEKMFLMNSKGGSSDQPSQGALTDSFYILDPSSVTVKQTKKEDEKDNTNETRLQDLEYTIATGKVIEGVLETAINSESPGAVRAVVSVDVLGEMGDYVLIPRGSRLYGSYTTATSTVQTRILLTWNKIIRPDGLVVSMSADTYDQSGKKGLEGDIDTRYGELFRNALLYSFITLGTAVAVEKIAGIKGSHITTNGVISSTAISPSTAAAQSMIDTAQDIADKMTDGITDDLDPVFSIPQGTLLKIMPSSDIVIKTPYKKSALNPLIN